MEVQNIDFYKGVGYYKRIFNKLKKTNHKYVVSSCKAKILEEENEELKQKCEGLLHQMNKEYAQFHDAQQKFNELYGNELKKNRIYEKYISYVKNRYDIIDNEDSDIKNLKNEYIRLKSWNGYIPNTCSHKCMGTCKGWNGNSEYCDCGRTKKEWVVIKSSDEEKKYILPISIINEINNDESVI